MNVKSYTFILFYLFAFSIASAQTVNLSGKVLRHNGDPLAGVTVTCTNAPSVVSAADGSFSFTDLPEGESYFINGVYDTDPLEDVTILDITFLSDVILGLAQDVPAVQLMAGDIGQISGSITTIDLVYLFQSILQINNQIPEMDWLFVEGNDNPNMFPTNAGITLNSVQEDMADLELVATKIGDVAMSVDHLPAPDDAPVLEYYFEDQVIEQGSEVSIEIKVKGFRDIKGLQQGISWDVNSLEYVSHEGIGDMHWNINESFAPQGDFIGIGFNSTLDDINLADDEVLYTLKFNALQDLNSIMDIIGFSEVIIAQQTIYRADNEWLYILESSNSIVTNVQGIEYVEAFDIFPNPVENNARVNIHFDQTTQAELVLLDILGRQIASWQIDAQNFQEPISFAKLPAGTYTLNLRTNDGVMTKKIIKQ